MARNTYKTFQGAVRYMFANRFGVVLGPQTDHDFDNDKALTWSDAADTTSISAMAVDTDGVLRLNRGCFLGSRDINTFYLNANAGLATQTFFIADKAMLITGIEYVHGTAGSSGSAVTAAIFHDTGTQAPGTGNSVQVGTFNCKGTAAVVQTAALLAVNGDGSQAAGLTLNPGDRLSVVFTGTLTSLAGVAISVFSAPGAKEEIATYNVNANATLATQTIFLANRDMYINQVNMIWSAAGTDAGAVTIDVTVETGTTAAGSGTSCLTAAQSAKTTANTVVTVPLSATATALYVAAGSRISVKFTGTLTALAGVVVCVSLQGTVNDLATVPYYGQVDANFSLLANGTQATQAFFIADRDYEAVDASVVWGTANGGGTLDITIDKGTTASGAGANTSILSGTIATTTTANTVNVGTMNVSRRRRLLSQGDRLSVLLTTVGALAGTSVTVSLLPR